MSMENSRNQGPNGIVFDVEARNHLEKECQGDVTKLRIGVAGVKFFRGDEYRFFEESQIQELARVLAEARFIIGFNLVGHNGFDYVMLENNGIDVQNLMPKTYDIMTVLIRSFGSYSDMSLDNIACHTLGITKPKIKKGKYKLVQAGRIDEVCSSLKEELRIIETLFLHIMEGREIRFKTPAGIIDEHLLPPFDAVPRKGEDVIKPYDMPLAGMRLQIKSVYDQVISCKKCARCWRVTATCYFGDTTSEDIFCQSCGAFLVRVRTSLKGPSISLVSRTVEP